MTKAKTAKPAKTEKKPAPAKSSAKAPAKTAPKAPAKAPSKTTAAVKKSPPKAAAKAPAKAPAKPEKKPAAPKAAPEKANVTKPTAKPMKSGDTDVVPAPAFSNAGLGVKTATKKPALSVAPHVMTLGRPAQAKQEQTPRPSERRLSKKELGEIRTFLLEKRERLLAGMRRELAMQKERAASKAADDVDKATDAYDEDLSFEIATANDQELGDIQIALEKIDKGTYGECEICGCGISPSRLKILPSATTCVACRGQEEMTRRRDDGQPLFNMMEDGEGEAEPM